MILFLYIALGGLLGYYFFQDPGYVLLSFAGYTVESNLIVLMGLCYGLMKVYLVCCASIKKCCALTQRLFK